MELSSSSLLRCCLAAASLTLTATAARAQTASTWAGGSGNWGNAALWSNGIPNSTGADAYIDGGKTGIASSVTLESSRSVGRVTIDAGDALTVSDGIALNVYNGAFTGSGSVVNNGSVTLNGSGGGFPTLQFYGAGAISGTGTMTLGGVNARIITATAGDRITIGAGQTVGGQGNLGGGAATFTNNGTVTANQNGAVLALRPGSGAGDFTNGAAGVARAENGGTLQLVGGSAGGNFSGGTFAALTGSQIQINTTTVSNATFASSGTGPTGAANAAGVINIVGPSTLANVTNNAPILADGVTTQLTGTFTNNLRLDIGLSTNTNVTQLIASGPLTLTGGGTIYLNNANASFRTAVAGDRITIAAGAGVSAMGDLGGGNTTFTNNGTISGSAFGGTLNIRPGGGTADFLNGSTGLVYSGSSDIVHFNGGATGAQFTNNGTFQVLALNSSATLTVDAGRLTNFSGSTLTGGSYIVAGRLSGTATLSLGGGTITTNAASVTLSGANSVFTEFNALATNTGTVMIQYGRNFSTVGALTNSGGVGVAYGSTLTVNGNFANTFTANPASVVLTNGTVVVTGTYSQSAGVLLSGAGTLTATIMTLDGTVNPGTTNPGSSGRLTLQGTVNTLASTAFQFALAAPGAVTNSQLAIQGNFTLAGSLSVFGQSGFGAGRYELIDYSGGTFTNNGLTFGSLPGGYNYALDYSTAGQVNLVVTNAVPEPATWTLLAAGFVLLSVLRRRQSKASA